MFTHIYSVLIVSLWFVSAWDLTGKWEVLLAGDDGGPARALNDPFSNEPFVIQIDRTDAVLKTQYITGLDNDCFPKLNRTVRHDLRHHGDYRGCQRDMRASLFGRQRQSVCYFRASGRVH